MAGNAERIVAMPRARVADDPSFLRTRVMPALCYHARDEVPWASAALADLCMVTNWSTLTEMVVPPGAHVVAHAPCSRFIASIPVDLAIIFHADADGTNAAKRRRG